MLLDETNQSKLNTKAQSNFANTVTVNKTLGTSIIYN